MPAQLKALALSRSRKPGSVFKRLAELAEDHLPQANDAKCGAACHTRAQATDYVFTDYGKR